MDSIATADRNGDRQARIDARADLLTRLGYGSNLILQCDPTDQKDVVGAFKERADKQTLGVSYDLSELETKFNAKFGNIVGGDTRPGEYWWSDYDKMFAVFVVEELSGEMVRSAKEKGNLGYFDKRKLDKQLEAVGSGYNDGSKGWDKMVAAVRSIRKIVSNKDISNVKLCLTGVDRIPSDEQPALFDYIKRFSVMSGVSLSFLAANIPYTAEYTQKDGALKGIPYDRLTVRGFGEPYIPADLQPDLKRLKS